MSLLIPTVQPGYFGSGSVEVAPPAAPGEGPARRLAITNEKLLTEPIEGVETVRDVLEYAARTFTGKNAVGWRDIVDVHEEKKEMKKVVNGEEVVEFKTWKYFELSDYKYLSFVEMEAQVTTLASALLDLGFTTEHVFNIYAQTSVNWQLMAHACASISTAIATAYDTLGESGLTHSLNEPDCIGLFTNAELLPTVANVLPSTPSIKFVIYDGTPLPSVLSKLRSIRSGIEILHINALHSAGAIPGQTRTLPADRRPTRETLACIMYTSGSTGPPKGVCITHGNLLASVSSVSVVFGHHLQAGDTYLAYLPLAHVLEYIVELCALFVGITSGYARPKTLTDASVRKCKGDLTAFRPHIMFGVPTVWETIRKGVLTKIKEGGLVKGLAFHAAMGLKRAGIPVLAGLADSIVLSKVRAVTGGRLLFTMNGGASISRDTQEFLSHAVVPMLQGYGMTESCGMCTLLPPELMQCGAVGLPVPSVEIKLLDVPNAGYFSTNDPPRGEVCIRGPSVTRGYFKRPDLNEDENVFTKDGWLRTGDVGQWNKDGTLSLIDRIKNLVKLQSGEYIALERLESIYKSCTLVANICVHATPAAKQPIAIIIPHEPNLRLALSDVGISDNLLTLEDLCKGRGIRELVRRECNAVGQAAGFRGVELLCGVVLAHEEWTPESGLVTPAQKIQRAKIAKEFEAQIEEAYRAK